MNLRRTLLAGALSLGLLGSIAAPATLADDVPVQVEVEIGGTYFVVICDPLASVTQNQVVAEDLVVLGNVVSPTASQAGSASGTIGVCYEDDIAYRADGFRTQLDAGNFTKIGDSSKTIAESNLTITATGGVAQIQSTTSTGGNPLIGDIGTYVNQSNPGGQPAVGTIVPWTTNNAFGTNPINVHFGYNGVGTIMSGGQVDLGLVIPVGTSPGTYQTTMTATIIVDPSIQH